MTVAYWMAAAAAMISAVQAVGELARARDRSPALAAWVLSMTGLAACLALAAAAPAVLQGWPGPVTWACAGLGVTGTWAFAEVLAATNGDSRRVADIMTIPLIAGPCVAMVLFGLHVVGSRGPYDADLAVIGTQLTLVVYYTPGLGRIATLAYQRASATPAPWARAAMRAVYASSAVEIVLILARSAVTVAGVSGMRTSVPAITVIGVLQGITAACGIGALAAGPMATLVSAQCESWLAYRRLRPLWAAVTQAVPGVQLPAKTGSVLSIRWHLQRRVREIRDAERVLRPYWREDVATRALVAQSAGLSPDLEQAVVEAAVVMNAASARLRGERPAFEPLPSERLWGSASDDPHAEVAWLVLVSQAIRHCLSLRDLAAEPAPERTT
jgi:hypothetical protein